jgi:penicillin-binding protein 1A
MPKHLIEAFVAIEDTEFFYHYGFSIRSIIRSFFKNIKQKSFVEGGSTITQQFIKLYSGNSKKTLFRKIKEICLAILLEACYTKEEIFQAYVNVLYFGKNILGVADCSRILFDKRYTDLSICESALLAAIIRRPEYYNPIKNIEGSFKRRNLVLKRMFEENYIKKNIYEQLIKEVIKINSNVFYNVNKSIYQAIEIDMKKLNLLLNHEYVIFTSLDYNIQNIATNFFNKHIESLKLYNEKIEGAVLITNYRTGRIIAIVNGYNLLNNFNRAFNWRKQIGSIIKPFIMYFALLNGDEKNTLYNDIPLEDQFKWSPKNHTKKFKGNTTITEALISSNNIIPIRILNKYGIKPFIKIIQPFFSYILSPYFSLALGCLEATPFEVASLFNTLLNDGIKNNLFYIEKIIKKSGGIVYENFNKDEKQYFEKEKTIEIKSILAIIGSNAAKKNNINFNTPIYLKTGTTNQAVSCWLVCADEEYSVIVCISSDNNIPLSKYNILSSNSTVPLGLKILKEISFQKNISF